MTATLMKATSKAEDVPTPTRKAQQPRVVVGVKGVRLKHFEHALVKLLPHVEPRYFPLGDLSSRADCGVPALKDLEELPSAARIHGTLPGQLFDKQKATRKEGQIKSLLKCIFAVLPNGGEKEEDGPLTIVDFGGGSGHLSIPLAILLPNCRIICLDLKQISLDFLHEKARKCWAEMGRELSAQVTASQTQADDCSDSNSRLNSTAIPNLFTYSGDIESYTDSFQIGVALHVCGEATDIVLRKCAQNRAHIVAAPCCVGKLNRQKKNPYIYQATAQNVPTVQYPQSKIFRQCLLWSDDQSGGNHESETTARYWDALAKAADYNHQLDMSDCSNAARRSAKGLLELDRQLYLQETFPYRTVLTRMDPLTASPKNDILLGYYHECPDSTLEQDRPLAHIFNSGNLQNDQVVLWTKEHLFNPSVTDSGEGTSGSPEHLNDEQCEQTNSVDWDWKEEEEVRHQITSYFELSESTGDTSYSNEDKRTEPKTLIFPTGTSRRQRKLIHYVAEQMGLAHWCLGKRYSEKTVAVRKKYVRST